MVKETALTVVYEEEEHRRLETVKQQVTLSTKNEKTRFPNAAGDVNDYNTKKAPIWSLWENA